MRKLYLAFILSISVFLTGCTSNNSTNEEFLLDCIEEVAEDDTCISTEHTDELNLGIIEYVESRDYILSTEETTYTIEIDYASRIYIAIFISSDNVGFSKELYEGTLTLFEDFYQMLEGSVFNSGFRLTVDYTNSTDEGIENILIQKASYQYTDYVELLYYVDQMTLNTITEQKELIRSILRESDDFDVTIALLDVDDTIEGNLNYQRFELMIPRGETQILYNLTPLSILITNDFTNEEFYQTLFDEFVQYTYLYNEE